MELRVNRCTSQTRNEEDWILGDEWVIGKEKKKSSEEEAKFRPKLARFNLPKVPLPEGIYYDSILESLNPEQLDFVYHVCRQLKGRKEPFYHFLSGPAGSGKSYVVQALAALCAILSQYVSGQVQKRMGRTDPCVLVLAPTEHAAIKINGLTPYDALAIPRSKVHGALPELPEAIEKYLRENLKNISLLVIDEISSMSMDLFSHINARLKQIFCCSNEFANLPVIVVGDIRQFSPSLDTEGLWRKFLLYELESNMSLKDEKWISVLNSLCNGELSFRIGKLLNSRDVVSNYPYLIPVNSVFLCSNQETADHYNHVRLKSLGKEYFTSDAFDTVTGSDNQDALLSLESFHERRPIRDIQGLRSTLMLVVSGRYMLSHNVDPSDGLVKGLIGLLVGVQMSCGGSVDVLWMLFEHKNRIETGTKTREKFLQFYRKTNSCTKDSDLLYTDKDSNLIPIVRISVVLKDNFVHNLTVIRSQFPVVPVEALTVEEFQGSFFDNALIPVLKGKKMSLKYLYAAASRVRQLRNLYLIGRLSEDDLTSGNGLWEKQSSCFAPLELEISHTQFNDESISIYVHNVDEARPVNRPYRDELWHMLVNPMLEYHDILIFLGCGIEAFFPDFMTSHCGPEPGYKYNNGRHAVILPNTILFSKSCVYCVSKCCRMGITGKKAPLSFYIFRISKDVILITGHAHPIYTLGLFLKSLAKCLRLASSCKNIIVVLSRENINPSEKSSMGQMMKQLNLKCALYSEKLNGNKSKGTTVIYTNIQNYNAQTQPSFFSHSNFDPVFFQAKAIPSLQKGSTDSTKGLVELRHCPPFSRQPKVGKLTHRKIPEEEIVDSVEFRGTVSRTIEGHYPNKHPKRLGRKQGPAEKSSSMEKRHIFVEESNVSSAIIEVDSAEEELVTSSAPDPESSKPPPLGARNRRKTPHSILPHAEPSLYVSKRSLSGIKEAGIMPVAGGKRSEEEPELKKRREGTEILIGASDEPGKQFEASTSVKDSSVLDACVNKQSDKGRGSNEDAKIQGESNSYVREQNELSMQVNVETNLFDASAKDLVYCCEEVHGVTGTLGSRLSGI